MPTIHFACPENLVSLIRGPSQMKTLGQSIPSFSSPAQEVIFVHIFIIELHLDLQP